MDHNALRGLTVAVFALTAVAMNLPWGKLIALAGRFHSRARNRRPARMFEVRPSRARHGWIAGRLTPARRR